MVPQSWIINCLKMYKISHEVVNFIEKTMKTWRVDLTAGGRSIAETKIQSGIFQGDALSALLFIITMMPLNHILRKYTAEYKLLFVGSFVCFLCEFYCISTLVGYLMPNPFLYKNNSISNTSV